jgi:hypothetical protein
MTMPTIEWLRERAALWKRCATHLRWRWKATAENEEQLERSFKNACRAADTAEAELEMFRESLALAEAKIESLCM